MTAPGPVTPARRFSAARAALGTAYITWAALPHRPPSPPWPAAPVAGILGARHLVQAALTWGRPTETVLVLGAGTDAAHAASMVLLGAVSRRWRAAAFADAALAASLSAAGLACARGGQDPAGRPSGPAKKTPAEKTQSTNERT